MAGIIVDSERSIDGAQIKKDIEKCQLFDTTMRSIYDNLIAMETKYSADSDTLAEITTKKTQLRTLLSNLYTYCEGT